MEFQGTIIAGLGIISALTSLITQAIKVMLGDKTYNSNVIAAIVSVVTSLFICGAYKIYTSTPIDAKFIIACVSMCVLSWLCAMLGYDKVMQTIANKGNKK